jgi:hypothetical protein
MAGGFPFLGRPSAFSFGVLPPAGKGRGPFANPIMGCAVQGKSAMELRGNRWVNPLSELAHGCSAFVLMQ